MTNCEHLIENALTRMRRARKAGMDTYQAFQDEMRRFPNTSMLNETSITKKELWEIAQYVMYVWNEE